MTAPKDNPHSIAFDRLRHIVVCQLSGFYDPAICGATANGEAIAAEILDRITRLEGDLLECRDFLEGQIDVVDGDYGEPAPNRAMQLCTMIDETLGRI